MLMIEGSSLDTMPLTGQETKVFRRTAWQSNLIVCKLRQRVDAGFQPLESS